MLQENLQKEAFEALQLQKDAKTQRITSQIAMIEQELIQLTMLEVEQRDMRLDTQVVRLRFDYLSHFIAVIFWPITLSLLEALILISLICKVEQIVINLALSVKVGYGPYMTELRLQVHDFFLLLNEEEGTTRTTFKPPQAYTFANLLSRHKHKDWWTLV